MSALAASHEFTFASASEPRGGYKKASAQKEATPAFSMPLCDVFFLGARPRLQLVPAIRVTDRVYRLNKPFMIRLEKSQHWYSAAYPELNVSGLGENVQEAFEEFALAFDAQWRGLVDCEEDELTPEAIVIRRKLVELAEVSRG